MPAKLVSREAEKRALRMIAAGKPASSWLLGQLSEDFFGNKATQEAFKRIKSVAKAQMEILSWSDLLADPALSQSTRSLLEIYDKKPAPTMERSKQLFKLLNRYRRLRIVFNGLKEVSDDLTKETVDDEKLIEKVTNIAAKAHSTAQHLRISRIGVGNNVALLAKNILYNKALIAIPTGFKNFDSVNRGIFMGSLMLLGGTTGGGKTAVALKLADNFADQGASVGFVSLEMSEEEVLLRQMSRYSGISMTKMIDPENNMTDAEKKRAYKAVIERGKKLKKKGVSVDVHVPSGDGGVGITDLLMSLKPYGYDVIFIDYIGLLKDADDDEQWKKLGQVARAAKVFAQANKCIIVLLAQVSAEGLVRYSRTMVEHCAREDSYVIYNNKMIRMSDLSSQQLEQARTIPFNGVVESFTGPRSIQKLHNYGKKPINCITLKKGYRVDVTDNTPLLRLNPDFTLEWIKSEHIKKNDMISIIKPKWSNSLTSVQFSYTDNEQYDSRHHLAKRLPTRMTNQLARLLGYLASEGHIAIRSNNSSVAHIISFCNADVAVMKDYAECWYLVFGRKISYKYNDNAKVWESRICSKQIFKYFEYLGAVGSSRTKQVPWPILQGSRQHAWHFLSTYYEGDGHAGSNHIACVTYSKAMATQIHLLLLRLSIVASKRRFKDKYKRKTKQKSPYYWRLSFSGKNVETFVANITPVTKFAALLNYKAAKSDSEGVPYILKALQKYKQGSRNSYINEFGQKLLLKIMGLLKRNPGGQNSVSVETLSDPTFLNILSQHFPSIYLTLKTIVDHNMMFLPVTKITKDEAVVMDFTLDEIPGHIVGDGHFFANGIAVHNSNNAWVFVRDSKSRETGIISVQQQKARNQKMFNFDLLDKFDTMDVVDISQEEMAKLLQAYDQEKGKGKGQPSGQKKIKKKDADEDSYFKDDD